jgi:hypothetical protein
MSPDHVVAYLPDRSYFGAFLRFGQGVLCLQRSGFTKKAFQEA